MNKVMEDPISLRARKHLDRFKLGVLFPAYEACWTPAECAELVYLISSQCLILDRMTPDIIDQICSGRRRTIGLTPLTGKFREFQYALQAIHGNFASSFDPALEGPRQAALTGSDYCWMGNGCVTFHMMLCSLVEASTIVLPGIIQKIMVMNPHELSPQKVASIIQAGGIGYSSKIAPASGA